MQTKIVEISHSTDLRHNALDCVCEILRGVLYKVARERLYPDNVIRVVGVNSPNRMNNLIALPRAGSNACSKLLELLGQCRKVGSETFADHIKLCSGTLKGAQR